MQTPIRPFRAFTSSPVSPRRNNEDDYDDDDEDYDDDEMLPSKRVPVAFIDTLDPHSRAHYESLSPADRKEFEAAAHRLDAHMNSPAVEARLSAAVSEAVYHISQEVPDDESLPPKIRPGFAAMGEVDEQGSGEDEEFDDDDITSLGHGELEQHREMREYARIAAWEMPLLSSTLDYGTVISFVDS